MKIKPKRFNSFRKRIHVPINTEKVGYRLVHIIQPNVCVYFIAMSGSMLVTTTDEKRAIWFRTRDEAIISQDTIYQTTGVLFSIV